MDLFKELKYTHVGDDCKAYRGPKGAEDVYVWKGRILTTNLDMLQVGTWLDADADGVKKSNPGGAVPGEIYEFKPDTGKFVVVKRMNFPGHVSFRPHGFGIFKNTMFVVNHAYKFGEYKASERADNFEMVVNDAGEIELFWLGAVFRDDGLGMYNSIAPVDERSFYITQWLPEFLYHHEDGARDHELLFTAYALSAPLFKKTNIFYCRDFGQFKDQCKPVAYPGKMWNGIAATQDGKTILSVDVLLKELHVFKREENNGLAISKVIHLEYLADNIRMSEDGKRAWIGGMAASTCHLFWVSAIKDARPREYPLGANANGNICAGHATYYDVDSGEVKTPVLYDGTHLGGVSGAVEYKDSIIMGSYVDDGLLVCPWKK